MALQGLSKQEVVLSREKFGSNTLTKKKRKSFAKSLLINFGDPMIKVLLIALSINLIFLFRHSNWFESVGIAFAVLLAVVVSTISEYGSESAFEKLQESTKDINCRVIREGKALLLPISQLVKGDIVLLGSGDRIPADGILIEGSLEVDQSSLNGESKEAKKFVTDNREKKDFLNPNLLFSSTVISGGEGVMQIESVGDNTFYGRLAGEIQEETPISPLKTKLEKLAKKISLYGYIGAGLVAFSYMFNEIILKNSFNGALILASIKDYKSLIGYLLNSLTLAVTVIVMAVPEGLPMMITVVLSANMRRMLKDNVLVRKLNGIETAGSINILFTDKTGTLTNGKLDVVNIIRGDGRIFKKEEFYNKSELSNILSYSLRINTGSQMSQDRAIGGNATDRVLLEFAQKLPNPNISSKKIKSVPFSSQNKFMSSILSDNTTLIKGAPEKILASCKQYYNSNGILTPFNTSSVLRSINELSQKAMRVIAVAISKTPVNDDNFKDLILVGLIGIKDQIRRDAVRGVKQVLDAGIQTVMITGDSANTAKAVAIETGILRGDEGLVLTSDELAKLSDLELSEKLKDLRVVARALPSDKSRLVKIAQGMNLVAGMTGDGVNDAPALKKADIGFAMGSGTEVAKEAGDVVILDDNIVSISRAVSYGRTIYKSIRKFIIFQLTINFCAMAISIIAPLFNIDTPITVIQMLWINLVIDTLAGIAFGGERPRVKYMFERPKKRDEPIINGYMWQQIIFTSIYISIISIWFLKSPIVQGSFISRNYALTAFFTLFMFIAIFNSLNARTHELNLLDYLTLNKQFIWIMSGVFIIQILLIYFGATIFRTEALLFKDLILILLISFSVIPIDLLRKFILKSKGREGGT